MASRNSNNDINDRENQFAAERPVGRLPASEPPPEQLAETEITDIEAELGRRANEPERPAERLDEDPDEDPDEGPDEGSDEGPDEGPALSFSARIELAKVWPTDIRSGEFTRVTEEDIIHQLIEVRPRGKFTRATEEEINELAGIGPRPHILTCPVCSDNFVDSKRRTPSYVPDRHRCSHGAKKLFREITVRCPVCLDSCQNVVALACGHVVCESDFEQLGGTTGPQQLQRTMTTTRPQQRARDEYLSYASSSISTSTWIAASASTSTNNPDLQNADMPVDFGSVANRVFTLESFLAQDAARSTLAFSRTSQSFGCSQT
eukprot:jgi/Psemu1/33865/gm1.33865_g